MTPQTLQLIRRLHHEVALGPSMRLVELTAGQVRTLLNCLVSEQRRADVAEARLGGMLERAAEKNLEYLLAPPAGGAATERPTACPPEP